MKSAPFLLAALLLVSGASVGAQGEVPSLPGERKPLERWQTGAFVFELLPKSLQWNPWLDMTVYTEMTPAGRRYPKASKANPVYYEMYPGEFRQLGVQTGGLRSPPIADLEAAMKRALATNGYLPAEPPDHPPTLLIFFHWGAVMFPFSGPDAGGTGFGMNLGRAEASRDLGRLMGPAYSPDPDRRLFLMEQARNDAYFVIASAYDRVALGKNERKLLWRTKMTVGAQGVSLKQTLQPLIANAAPYFGREMRLPEIAVKRAMPRGKVELGVPEVVEYMPATEPGAPSAPTEPKPKPADPRVNPLEKP